MIDNYSNVGKISTYILHYLFKNRFKCIEYQTNRIWRIVTTNKILRWWAYVRKELKKSNMGTNPSPSSNPSTSPSLLSLSSNDLDLSSAFVKLLRIAIDFSRDRRLGPELDLNSSRDWYYSKTWLEHAKSMLLAQENDRYNQMVLRQRWWSCVDWIDRF